MRDLSSERTTGAHLGRGEKLSVRARESEGGLFGRVKSVRSCVCLEEETVKWGDAAGDTAGPRFFNLEPDGFAVLGGLNAAVEYVDPAIRRLLPALHGELARSADQDSRRVSDVFHQVLETGVAALIRGLPATSGGSVDLMLKRIDADGGRKVLALARVHLPEPIVTPGPGAPAERPAMAPEARAEQPERPPPTTWEPPPSPEPTDVPLPPSPVSDAHDHGAARFERTGPLPRMPSADPEGILAAEPIEPGTGTATTRGSFGATLERVGLALQSCDEPEAGLDMALRDAAVALGSSTASIMLRRNRTSVVAFIYGMPPEYRGVRFRDDTYRTAAEHEAGEVIAIENVAPTTA